MNLYQDGFRKTSGITKSKSSSYPYLVVVFIFRWVIWILA